MTDPAADQLAVLRGDLATAEASVLARKADPHLRVAGQAALEAAAAMGRKAAAPATLRAYRADWTHYAA